MSATSDRIRREFAASDAVRDAGLTTPDDIQRFDDIAYGSHPLQKLDIYRPKEATGLLPVIVSVHGGGWVYGDKELYQYYTMSLAQRGFAVINFSYRLAPESRYPAQMEDVATVFDWVNNHAAQYGMDANNLFAVGDSAGAHLLSLYCAACTNPEYAGRYPFSFGPTPKAISLACGVYTIEKGKEQDMKLMEDLLPGGPTTENLEWVDVKRWLTPAFPETFLFTCTGDFLQEQADAMQVALREKQVPHIMRFYGDSRHELGHVFHCDMRSEAGRRCNDEQCAFFGSVHRTLDGFHTR